MRTVVIYHSDTGHTSDVAEYIARKTGADLIQVHSRFPYNHLSRMIVGVRRALSGTEDPVDPTPIDVAGYDCIVIGSPVWSGHPTPVINGAITNLKGCAGKEGVVFVTCCLAAGMAPEILRDSLRKREIRVKGSMVVHGSQREDYAYLNRIVTMITEARYGQIPLD
jgi:flavodoxin